MGYQIRDKCLRYCIIDAHGGGGVISVPREVMVMSNYHYPFGGERKPEFRLIFMQGKLKH
jgi:hypothetical protein